MPKLRYCVTHTLTRRYEYEVRVNMSSIFPTGIEVSNHFFHDALDFSQRYNFCINNEEYVFFASKSKRSKMFIDLRMGIEAILKSLVCYFLHDERKGKNLVNWIEKHGHCLTKMWAKLSNFIPNEMYVNHTLDIQQMDKLPVGLRYRYDAWSFRGAKQDLYYQTVGSDLWLQNMATALTELIELADRHLSSHSRVVSVADTFEELFGERYEKYS